MEDVLWRTRVFSLLAYKAAGDNRQLQGEGLPGDNTSCSILCAADSDVAAHGKTKL